MKKLYYILFLVLNACAAIGGTNRAAVCPPVINQDKLLKDEARKALAKNVYYSLGIIGEVEPVYIRGLSSVFPARIDTGATTSSIDAKNIREFERDGVAWVSFEVENRLTKEKITFEKKVNGITYIDRQESNSERRIKVDMEIKIGNQEFTREFTLANREKFEYQVLIGRNILNGLAVVDTSIKNTLN